jgi:hypothetical protein
MSNTSDSADSADRIIPPALSNGDFKEYVLNTSTIISGIFHGEWFAIVFILSRNAFVHGF